MMKITVLIMIIGTLIIGCAGPKVQDPNYALYQQAMKEQPPLVDIKWSEDGQRIKQLTVNPQMNIQQKQPDAPHPAWAVVNSFVRAAGIVGGIWAGGQAIEGIVEAGRGTTIIEGSYNSPGENMAGGNIDIPTTTTTITTTTDTVPEPEPLP